MSIYDNNTALLAKIAWLYYIQGWTQDEIARKFGFSRPTVTRQLAKAKELGIVEIKVSSHYRMCIEMEESLKKRFNLCDAIVVPTCHTTSETKEGVGKACAAFLEKTLCNGDILGITWGSSLYEVSKFLQLKESLDLTVIQLLGGLNTGEKMNPEEIVKSIATKLNATGVWLNTPAVVGTPEIKEALLSDEGVKTVLAKAKNCTKCVLGLGDVTDDASILVTNMLSYDEMTELRSLGAVGDICGWFFDINGRPVKSSISSRIIAVPLEDIKQIPFRTGVTSGPKKVKTILGAIHGDYINVLITDEETAQSVLKL